MITNMVGLLCSVWHHYDVKMMSSYSQIDVAVNHLEKMGNSGPGSLVSSE
jgi:hypothetical protein